MLQTVISRGMTEYASGLDRDVEIAIEIEGRVNTDGQAEITSAKHGFWHYWKNDWVYEDVELTDSEEARALSQLQAMVPEYLAGLAQKAVDDRVDEARGK